MHLWKMPITTLFRVKEKQSWQTKAMQRFKWNIRYLCKILSYIRNKKKVQWREKGHVGVFFPLFLICFNSFFIIKTKISTFSVFWWKAAFSVLHFISPYLPSNFKLNIANLQFVVDVFKPQNIFLNVTLKNGITVTTAVSSHSWSTTFL